MSCSSCLISYVSMINIHLRMTVRKETTGTTGIAALEYLYVGFFFTRGPVGLSHMEFHLANLVCACLTNLNQTSPGMLHMEPRRTLLSSSPPPVWQVSIRLMGLITVPCWKHASRRSQCVPSGPLSMMRISVTMSHFHPHVLSYTWHC